MYIKHPDKIFSTTVIKYYCSSSKLSTYYFWQGRQGSNLRPSVLETDALPTELLPYQDAKFIKERFTLFLYAKYVSDPTYSIFVPPYALFSISCFGKLYNFGACTQCILGESCLS